MSNSGKDPTAGDSAAGAAEALAELRSSMQSVQLSTVSVDGEPHCGYTPFLIDELDLYIFVSQLSLHTRDLLATPRAGVMLIADEQSSSQIFARTRVSYQCRASVVTPDDSRYEALLDAFQARHGKMIGLLRQLPDFVLFRLQPQSGQFVMGFGQAFKLTGEALDRFEHAKTA